MNGVLTVTFSVKTRPWYETATRIWPKESSKVKSRIKIFMKNWSIECKLELIHSLGIWDLNHAYSWNIEIQYELFIKKSETQYENFRMLHDRSSPSKWFNLEYKQTNRSSYQYFTQKCVWRPKSATRPNVVCQNAHF